MGIETLSWGEHGLVGLIIGTLFIFIFYIVKTMLQHMRTMHDDHKTERTEWRASEERKIDKLGSSLDAVVSEMRRK